jgi:hypothetical protein
LIHRVLIQKKKKKKVLKQKFQKKQRKKQNLIACLIHPMMMKTFLLQLKQVNNQNRQKGLVENRNTFFNSFN